MPRKGENIYKRKDGRWELRLISFYDEAGRAHYKSYYAPSYKEARQKKAELLKAGWQSGTKPEKNKETFKAICLQWLGHVRPLVKESSYVKYQYAVTVHIIPALGDWQLCGIDTPRMETFFNALLTGADTAGCGLSPKSVADIKSIVRQIFAYAESKGLPAGCNIEHIRIKQEQKHIRVLSCEEQAILENYLLKGDSYVCFGIYLCLYSGMRLGEICALRWGDIDLEAGTVWVDKTMQRIRDEEHTSGKKTKVVVTTAKSACSIRSIPLPGFLHDKIKRMKLPCQDNAYVLTGSGTRYMEPRALEYHFKKITAECKIADFNFHGLRHTFATRCVELGFDIKTLSEILGHANVNITLNRYVHPSMELKRSNMERLGRITAVR